VLKRSDRGLLWLNSLFPLWLAFIPYPTALMGDFPGERIAVMGCGAVTTLAGVSFTFMRYYAFYLAKLVDENIDARLLRSAMLKSVLNPILHAIAVLLAFVDTRLSIALYIILRLMFFIPSKLESYVHLGHTGSRWFRGVAGGRRSGQPRRAAAGRSRDFRWHPSHRRDGEFCRMEWA
jgi:uncharacterized membrane protein